MSVIASGYTSAQDVARRIGGAKRAGRGWKCICPAHDDHDPSLSVWDTNDPTRPIGIKCNAGCAWKDVVSILEESGILPRREGYDREGNDHVAAWDYHDLDGNVLFQVRRYNRPDGTKHFVPFRQEGGRFAKGLTYGDGRKVANVPYRLRELAAADDGEWILLVEGEKCADCAVGLGFIATTNQGGAKGWKDEFAQWFRGRRVVIMPDNDEAGYKRINLLGRSLAKYASEIRVLELPVGHKGDIYDWVEAGGDRDALWGMIDAAPAWDENQFAEVAKVLGFPDGRILDQPPPDNHGRLSIKILPGEISSMVDQAEAAMLAIPGGCGLYKFGPNLVQIREEEVLVSGGAKEKSLHTSQIGKSRLYELFSLGARWLKYIKMENMWVSADPPEKVAEVYLARDGRWNVRVLAGVVNTPFLRRDGSVVDTPGYDDQTGLIYEPLGWSYPPVPSKPSRRSAERAMRILKKPFSLYNFETLADYGVALSGVMTAVLRRSMPTAPLHAFDGNIAGVGKSTLVDVASVVATGHRAAVMCFEHGHNGGLDEFKKAIYAALLAGEQVITLDNMEESLGGAFLNSILTQHMVNVRIFGKLENVRVPSISAIYASGNNMVIEGDANRRVLCGRVYTNSPEPEKEKFPFEPVALALKKRRSLVWAVLVIARWYATQPRRARVLGSFEEWCRLVREPIVDLLGEDWDPCKVMERAKSSDPRLNTLMAVADAWSKHVGIGVHSPVNKLIDAALDKNGRDDSGNEGDFKNKGLLDVIKSVASGGKDSVVSSVRLSNFLRSNRGRTIKLDDGEFCFQVAQGRREGYTTKWVLERPQTTQTTREPI